MDIYCTERAGTTVPWQRTQGRRRRPQKSVRYNHSKSQPDIFLQKQDCRHTRLNETLYIWFRKKNRYKGSPRTRRGKSPTIPIASRISRRLSGGRR